MYPNKVRYFQCKTKNALQLSLLVGQRNEKSWSLLSLCTLYQCVLLYSLVSVFFSVFFFPVFSCISWTFIPSVLGWATQSSTIVTTLQNVWFFLKNKTKQKQNNKKNCTCLIIFHLDQLHCISHKKLYLRGVQYLTNRECWGWSELRVAAWGDTEELQWLRLYLATFLALWAWFQVFYSNQASKRGKRNEMRLLFWVQFTAINPGWVVQLTWAVFHRRGNNDK